jgi:hypothetical protein
MSNIANGTHATLGNDCNPTANEFIVFPKPGNFTIARPTVTPIIIEVANPTARRYMVIAMLIMSVKF